MKNIYPSMESFDFYSFLLGSIVTISLGGLSKALGGEPLVEIPTQIILSSILLVISLAATLHYYYKTRPKKDNDER